MPWPDRLPAALRRLYRAADQGPKDLSVPPLSLEQDLMARHARLRPAPAPPGLRGFARAHRWALASGLGALVAAGACRLPLDYEHNFGASVSCSGDRVGRLHDPARGLADLLQRTTGADQIAVRVAAEEGRDATLRVDLWGAEEVGPELLREIEAQAGLPASSCAAEPLVGTVHGTLGGRLGLELFDLELLDRADAEAARLQILERLEARGLRGDARVEISDHGDGRREIRIEVEAEHPADAEAGQGAR